MVTVCDGSQDGKDYVTELVLSKVSDIDGESWNVFPAVKKGLLYRKDHVDLILWHTGS